MLCNHFFSPYFIGAATRHFSGPFFVCARLFSSHGSILHPALSISRATQHFFATIVLYYRGLFQFANFKQDILPLWIFLGAYVKVFLK